MASWRRWHAAAGFDASRALEVRRRAVRRPSRGAILRRLRLVHERGAAMSISNHEVAAVRSAAARPLAETKQARRGDESPATSKCRLEVT